MKSLIAFFLLICLCQSELCSQSSTNESVVDLKTFGIGIGLLAPILNGYNEPFAHIIITVNINQKFRIEPEFGFSIENFEEENDYSTKSQTYLFALNGLAIFKSNHTGLLLGPKFGYMKDYEQYQQQNFDPSESDRKSIFIGPVIGLEYYVSTHISISGEFDFLYLKAFGYGYEEDKITGNTYKSEASLKIHFYL